MVGGLKRGEGSEEEQRDGKLISSWAYTANPGDSSVHCFALNQEGKVGSSASIAFVVKEEQVVTLRNIEDKKKVENKNDVHKTAAVKDNLNKLEVQREKEDAVNVIDVADADADAVDTLAGFAAAAPEEQFFEAGEEKLEAVDLKIGNGGTSKNKVELVANTFASKASPLFSSSLLLLLLLTFNL